MDVASNSATTEALRDLHAGDVNTVADALAALVCGLVPGDVPLSWTPGIWSAFDRAERLAAGAKVLLDDRLAESKAWERAGFANPAEYMANRAGTTISAARDALAASRRLGDLPTTRDKVRAGALSVSQAHHISDAATHNPDAEHDLLAMTEDGSSFSELRDACGRAKAAADTDPEGRRDRLHAARRLRQRRETDGAWSLWAQGTTTDAVVFNAAIEEIIDDLLQDARETGQPLSREQAAYDAFMEMANRINTTDWTDDHEPDADRSDSDEPADNGTEALADNENDGQTDTASTQTDSDIKPTDDPEPHDDATADNGDNATAASESSESTGDEVDGLAHNDGEASGGVANTTSRSGRSTAPPPGTPLTRSARKKRPRRKAQPYLGIVRADLAALHRGFPLDGEVVEIAGIGPITVQEARELLGGDTVLQLVLTNGVAANVTNFRRSPNNAQRAALLAEMPCCTVKGCPRTWTQIDHRHDWAKTKVTQLEDLDPLCWRHHKLKTLDGWALVNGTGKRAFVPPTDPRHPTNTGRARDTSARSTSATRTGPQPTDTPPPNSPRPAPHHPARTSPTPPPNSPRPVPTGRGGLASMAFPPRQRTKK